MGSNNLINLLNTMSSSENKQAQNNNNLFGNKIVVNNTTYFIVSPNNGLPEYISLYNPVTRKFLRCYVTKLIESAPNFNEKSFLNESSFIHELEDEKLILKVTKEGKHNACICQVDQEYIIKTEDAGSALTKARFQIMSSESQSIDALNLELEVIKLKFEASQKKIIIYQEYLLTTFLALIRSHNRALFNTGASIWNFIDHRNCIKARHSTFEQLELFFYQKFSWDNKCSELTDKTDLYLKYGAYATDIQISQLNSCIESNIPVLFGEDGFIHSINSTSIFKNRREFRLGYSINVDAISPYFDATLPTSIENELNSEYSYSKAEIDRAKKLIAEIVKNKITKYNGQPLNPDIEIDYEKFKSRVLVVDQVCNDWSIKKGYANEQIFITMLEAAIDENPESLILVKVHPVMLANPYMHSNENRKFGHYTNYRIKPELQDRVKFIAISANPYTILDLVQKVYVCSSQFGFEALMAGKEVHIWGSPFYAGWGIGIQRINSPAIERRRRKRSLEEIFLCAYITYSRYLNPYTYERCELEEFLKVLPGFRNSYFKYQKLLQSGFKNFTEPVLTENIPIIFALDETHSLQTILAISSLLHSDPGNKYYIYCLSVEILPPEIQKIITQSATVYKNLAGIEFISCHVYTDLECVMRIPAIKLLKFKLPEIFKTLPRAVYSDSNVIFLKGISNAWQVSSDFKALISACPDLDENLKRILNNIDVRCRFWDKFLPSIRCVGRYINDSFLILNLDIIRQSGIERIWKQYLQKSDDLNASDILFLGCNPKIYYLSARYAITQEFFTDESKYIQLFQTYLPPEDLILVKEKAVAVQYPENTPPWLSQSKKTQAWWTRFLKTYPELNEIIQKYAKLINDIQPDKYPQARS